MIRMFSLCPPVVSVDACGKVSEQNGLRQLPERAAFDDGICGEAFTDFVGGMFGLGAFACIGVKQIPLPIRVVGTGKLADPDAEEAIWTPVTHLIKERPRGAVNDIGKLRWGVE